ncbi:MAG: DEAD/DEAH box helicase [Lactobacillaceae bacterium]
MVKTIYGTTSKPIASEQIGKIFEEFTNQEGILYTGYPIIGTVNGPYPIDCLFISPKYGSVIINLIEGVSYSGYEDAQDESFNKMEAKLKNYRELNKRRKLIVPLTVVTFCPNKTISPEKTTEDYPIYDKETIRNIFNNLDENVNDYTYEDYQKVLSVIQSVSTVRKNINERKINSNNSRGAKLRKIEDSISNLDRHQSSAVIETVDGVQRIRGLAGSGKTIILALKAAYIHAQHPEWNIAITFNTRALKDQFKNLISTFYIEQTNQFPDWSKLQILHAWGAPGGGEKDGIYYQFCKHQKNNFYRDFRSAASKYTYNSAFSGACSEAFNNKTNDVPTFDLILIDEAQDFSPDFFKICFSMLKDTKRLVYAYDELQSLTGNSLPSPEELFGENQFGKVNVKFDPIKFPSQDIVLETCYRNPRPILATAHALGFGIYRDVDSRTGTGLVQIFDNNDLWEEVGYSTNGEEIVAGQGVSLSRTNESSPKFLEEHSTINDLIQFENFENKRDQDNWLVEQIIKNIKEDELLYKDIIIINPDPLQTKEAVGYARARLFDKGINSHITGVTTSPDKFFEDNSIAFTGIYRAKGNEAAMVYIINSQDCYASENNLQTVRNRLFTAITRSKAWVRVLGFGSGMEHLKNEYESVRKHNFSLDFKYPTENQKEKIRVINKDKSESEQKQINMFKKNINNIYDSVSKGKISIESLSEKERQIIIDLAGKIGRPENGQK